MNKKTETAICRYCGVEFEREIGQDDIVWCSEKCAELDQTNK